MFWPIGVAIGQPAAPPEPTWQGAVDQYLLGNRAASATILFHNGRPLRASMAFSV